MAAQETCSQQSYKPARSVLGEQCRDLLGEACLPHGSPSFTGDSLTMFTAQSKGFASTALLLRAIHRAGSLNFPQTTSHISQ